MMKKIVLFFTLFIFTCFLGCSNKDKALTEADAVKLILNEYPSALLDADENALTIDGFARIVAEFCTYYTDYILCDHGLASNADFAEALELFSEIYADTPDINFDSSNIVSLRDVEKFFGDSSFEKGLIKPFPENSSNIDREYIVRKPQVWDIIYNFSSKTSSLGSQSISSVEVSRMILKLNKIFGMSQAKPAYINHSVGGELDWFMTQHGSGEYEKINCMPTMAGMAILRLTGKKITAEKLRAEIKVKGAWYLYDVRKALKKYKISFLDEKVSEENIISSLDNNMMILVKCSYADNDQISHCMIIYGYKRYGDAIWLLCADPDKEEPHELPLYYSLYIIKRCTTSFIAIPTP